MKTLTNIKTNLINFFKFIYAKITGNLSELEIEDINDALLEAIKKKQLNRLKLQKEIKRFLFKKFGYSQSKYIPSRRHNKTELFMSVQDNYGERMRKLQMELTPNLTWKK